MRKAMVLFAVTLVFLVTSCDKGDMEVQKLNRGKGIWEIETVRYDYYNAAGTSVDSSRSVSSPGEFVFFNNTTLNGLFDEHLAVVNIFNANGTVTAFPGGIYYDDNRAKIDAGSMFDGVWTVVDNGRRKQEWALYGVYPTGSLATKTTIFLKKK